MAETETLHGEKRTSRGTRRARRLRAAGQVPAVVYGHKEDTVAIAVPAEEINTAMRHGVRIVDLKVGGTSETALIRDVQWDPYGMEIMHVDFTRVSRHEKIQVEVGIEMKGVAPGTSHGGVLEQLMHALSIECPAMSVPDAIRVNINELEVGQAIHVKELELPEGVQALNDPDEIVVHVVEKAAEEDEEETAAGETAEPEVIKREQEGEPAEGE